LLENQQQGHHKSQQPAEQPPVTRAGETDLLFFDLKKSVLVNKLVLTPFIQVWGYKLLVSFLENTVATSVVDPG
jgi:hypothetical protein